MLDSLALLYPAWLEPFFGPGLLWPVALIALLALVYTAAVDAFTGLVPPMPLILAGVLIVATLVWKRGDGAFYTIGAAALFFAAVWTVNRIWRFIYNHDALGMGDASWSALAVLAYGWHKVVQAWGVGAILALIFMFLLRLIGRRTRRVHLAPFLLAGLLLAITVKLPF